MLSLTAILNPPSGEPEQSLDQGGINFPPFENLDEASRREVQRFKVPTLGRIHESSRRIPYNTNKRDFPGKTGRACLEVFQYDFTFPSKKKKGEEETEAIMWDYKIGLVRTTPFFKALGYVKTVSSKMLGMNPGLKEITHSITGGAIKYQGYWMPYHCAKAVCATFCYPIAGALIPLFGPDFPSKCIPPNSPQYGRMAIDPAIVQSATREAEYFRQIYGELPGPGTPRPPRGSTRPQGGYEVIPPPRQYRPEYRPEYHPADRQYQGWQTGTDSDAEGSSLDRYPRLPPLQTHFPTPVLSSGESSYNLSTAQSSPRPWTAANSQPYRQYGSHESYVRQAQDEEEEEWQRRRGEEQRQRQWYQERQRQQPRQQLGRRQEPYPKRSSQQPQPHPDPFRSVVSSSPNYREHFWRPPPAASLQYQTPRDVGVERDSGGDVGEVAGRDAERNVTRPAHENQSLEVRHPPARRPVIRGHQNASVSASPRDKRSFDDYGYDYDYDYDAGESASASGSSPEAPSPQAFQSSRPPQSHAQSRAHVGQRSRLSDSQRLERFGLPSAGAGAGVSSSSYNYSYGSDGGMGMGTGRSGAAAAFSDHSSRDERGGQDRSGNLSELSETDPASGARSRDEVRGTSRRVSELIGQHRRSFPPLPPPVPPYGGDGGGDGYAYGYGYPPHPYRRTRSPGPEASRQGHGGYSSNTSSGTDTGSGSRRGSSSSSSRGGANVNVNSNINITGGRSPFGGDMAMDMDIDIAAANAHPQDAARYSLRGVGTDTSTSPDSFSGSGSGSGAETAETAETMAAQALLVLNLGMKDSHRGEEDSDRGRPQHQQPSPRVTYSDREAEDKAVHSQVQSPRQSQSLEPNGAEIQPRPRPRYTSPSIDVDVDARYVDGHGTASSSPAHRGRVDTFATSRGRQSPRELGLGLESDEDEVDDLESATDRQHDHENNFAPRRGSRDRKRRKRRFI